MGRQDGRPPDQIRTSVPLGKNPGPRPSISRSEVHSRAARRPPALGPVLRPPDFVAALGRFPAPSLPATPDRERPRAVRPSSERILLIRLLLIEPSCPASRHA